MHTINSTVVVVLYYNCTGMKYVVGGKLQYFNSNYSSQFLVVQEFFGLHCTSYAEWLPFPDFKNWCEPFPRERASGSPRGYNKSPPAFARVVYAGH